MWRKYLYLGILAAFGVLLLLCRRESLPEGTDASSIRRPFCRAAAWIVRVVSDRGTGHRGRFFFGSREEAVGRELGLLDPSRGMAGRHYAYIVDKVAAALIFGMLSAFLALAVCSSEEENTEVAEGRYIQRDGYDGEARDVTVIASEEQQGTEQKLGEYVVHVDPRQYTAAQARQLAQEAIAALPDAILGGNADLSHVNDSLNLVRSLPDYPFRISWESSDYSLIDTDGTVLTDSLEGEEPDPSGPAGQQVTLTAHLSYAEDLWETSIPVRVVPGERTQEEIRQDAVAAAITRSTQESREETRITLPSEGAGGELIWKEPEDTTDVVIFLLILGAGVLVWCLSDRKIHEQAEKRRQQMRLDYPGIVSRMALFLGAGMSIRSVFGRLGQEYAQSGRKGGEKRYVYEEILLVCHELESGVSEQEAYAHFGRRCGLREYTKLCSLLSQNLRKGNSELLRVLQEEAESASEQRRQTARQLGEEAGTKLLIPMIMMLAITLVMIIIPAFYGFAM